MLITLKSLRILRGKLKLKITTMVIRMQTPLRKFGVLSPLCITRFFFINLCVKKESKISRATNSMTNKYAKTLLTRSITWNYCFMSSLSMTLIATPVDKIPIWKQMTEARTIKRLTPMNLSIFVCPFCCTIYYLAVGLCAFISESRLIISSTMSCIYSMPLPNLNAGGRNKRSGIAI